MMLSQSGFNHIVLITRKENKKYLEEYLNKRLPKHIKIDISSSRGN